MKINKISILMLLLCFCLQGVAAQVLAVATSDAVAPMETEKLCDLTLSYGYGETMFSGAEVKLYKVAEVSADLRYTLTQPFADTGLVLNDIQTTGEWNVVRSTLEAHILANAVAPEATSATNEDGQVRFEALKTGMYLATVGRVMQDSSHYRFDSALLPLPELGQDGHWQYQVTANAKGELLPPEAPDRETQWKVLKLWKGDEGRNDRPKSIAVEIFCDGILYETVTLSEANHWSYTWSSKGNGAEWAVVEPNVPGGYRVTVEERESTFVLTNTRIPTKPEGPGKLPQTGDTSNIMLYILIMLACGMMLIILGMTGKKKQK